MAREIELKLALAPGDTATLRASPVLAAAKPVAEDLLAIYFDTPRRELAQAHMALRLRRHGKHWVQTLKAGRSGTGGMHERSEWEFERPGPAVDLSLFADTPLAGLADADGLHERLAEVFRVESRRTVWHLEPAAGTRLEAVLDEGRVVAKGRAEDICEVEVETLEGEPAAAFDLAARLLETVTLRPSAVTKAERGHRLAQRRRWAPAKARAVALDTGCTLAAAARAVVAAGLAQLQANEAGLLETGDPEFVHQARVALRRMRSALRIFRDPIGRERAQAWHDELGDLGNHLGAARDWDVVGTQTLPPVLAAFGDEKVRRQMMLRVAHRRRREREGAREAIRSRRYAAVVLDLSRWIALEEPAPPTEEPSSLPDFAARVVRKRHKQLLADATNLESLAAPERHKVRIDAKRLRYGVDALSALFPGKRVDSYLEALVALQDCLGHGNDAAAAARLAAELDPPEPLAAFARGWFAANAAGDPMVYKVLLEGLEGAPRFWRHASK